MTRLQGHGAAPGVAAARALILATALPELPRRTGQDPRQELARAEEALRAVTDQVRLRRDRAAGAGSQSQAEIFDAHLEILQDPELMAPVRALLDGGVNAEAAMADGLAEIAAIFEAMEDPYFAQRAADIQDLRQQILGALLGVERPDYQNLTEDVVVVARELLPSDTARLDLGHVAGFLTATGGETSHVVLIARSLGIAAVVCPGAPEAVRAGQTVVLDGNTGQVLLDPDPEDLAQAQAALADQARRREALAVWRDRETRTRDGVPIPLLANVGDPQPAEENPFLGIRGLRLYFRHPELFRAQLRAILRAAAFGPVGVLFPMVGSLGELLAAKEALAEARASLERESVPCGPVKVGAMIEIPAAALCAEQLAAHCDFFSIGTNDLTAYTLAADRGNAQVAAYYAHSHPAVLRLIATTCAAARKAGIPCCVCGEAAGDEAMQPILAGLGVSKLSMAAPAILPSRERLARWTLPACEALAQKALACTAPQEVLALERRETL